MEEKEEESGQKDKWNRYSYQSTYPLVMRFFQTYIIVSNDSDDQTPSIRRALPGDPAQRLQTTLEDEEKVGKPPPFQRTKYPWPEVLLR